MPLAPIGVAHEVCELLRHQQHSTAEKALQPLKTLPENQYWQDSHVHCQCAVWQCGNKLLPLTQIHINYSNLEKVGWRVRVITIRMWGLITRSFTWDDHLGKPLKRWFPDSPLNEKSFRGHVAWNID